MASSYTIGAHFESFIKEMVESGRYASASEVMRDSLRLMEERETIRQAKLDALRLSISEGLDSGASETLDMTEIKSAARGQKRITKSTAHRGR